MNRLPMWKRILAWQSTSPQNSAVARIGASSERAIALDNAPEPMLPAWIAAQKSGVAVERELAKVMW